MLSSLSFPSVASGESGELDDARQNVGLIGLLFLSATEAESRKLNYSKLHEQHLDITSLQLITYL